MPRDSTRNIDNNSEEVLITTTEDNTFVILHGGQDRGALIRYLNQRDNLKKLGWQKLGKKMTSDYIYEACPYPKIRYLRGNKRKGSSSWLSSSGGRNPNFTSE